MDAFWREEMSLRRLWVLIEYLPRTSPFQREVMGQEEAEWTPELRMHASVIEQIQNLTFVLGAVNADKFKGGKNPVPKPKPIPRPGVSEAAQSGGRGKLTFGGKNPSSRDELARFFGKPRVGKD